MRSAEGDTAQSHQVAAALLTFSSWVAVAQQKVSEKTAAPRSVEGTEGTKDLITLRQRNSKHRQIAVILIISITLSLRLLSLSAVVSRCALNVLHGTPLIYRDTSSPSASPPRRCRSLLLRCSQLGTAAVDHSLRLITPLPKHLPIAHRTFNPLDVSMFQPASTHIHQCPPHPPQHHVAIIIARIAARTATATWQQEDGGRQKRSNTRLDQQKRQQQHLSWSWGSMHQRSNNK